jgi:stringent starvation protein B
MSELTSRQKRKVLEEYLREQYAFIHINTAIQDVSLPDYLLEQENVTLKVSNFFRMPLAINEEGVAANLLFGDKYFKCSAPWQAIWAISNVSGKARTWQEELAKTEEEAAKLLNPDQLIQIKDNQIKDSESEESLDLQSSSKIKEKSKTRPNLKRIK